MYFEKINDNDDFVLYEDVWWINKRKMDNFIMFYYET